MNNLLFGIKNIYDKLLKIKKNPDFAKFYLNRYVLSMFEKAEPDIYVVSYPKCGSTWVKAALRRYLELTGHQIDSNKNPNIINLPKGKTLKFTHDMGHWVPAPVRTDLLKFNTSKYRGKKICFLVRDPRDILVSSWYHLKYREKIFTGELTKFIRDHNSGIYKIAAFMNMWLQHIDLAREYYILTYESLRINPDSKFNELFNFIGLKIDTNIFNLAIKETSFEKMKKIEKKGVSSEPWRNVGDRKTEKSMKTRKGKIGSYKEELCSNDIEFLNNIIISTLSKKLPYAFSQFN